MRYCRSVEIFKRLTLNSIYYHRYLVQFSSFYKHLNRNETRFILLAPFFLEIQFKEPIHTSRSQLPYIVDVALLTNPTATVFLDIFMNVVCHTHTTTNHVATTPTSPPPFSIMLTIGDGVVADAATQLLHHLRGCHGYLV